MDSKLIKALEPNKTNDRGNGQFEYQNLSALAETLYRQSPEHKRLQVKNDISAWNDSDRYSNPKWWMHKGPLFAVAQQIF